MGNKVKIVGYAKKTFYNDGIEYRNFSPDLVGNQRTSDIGTPIFTSGNFNVTTNLEPKVDKRFITNTFGDFKSLDSMSIDSTVEDLFFISEKKIKLNLNKDDITNFAFFGSLREYVRVSLENIIITWPASLSVESHSQLDPNLSGDTVTGYTFDSATNKASFDVSTDRVINSFNINFLLNGTIIDTYNESNDLRNLTINYVNYVISNEYGDFPISKFIGASADTNTIMSFEVVGNPFPNIQVENINYHIKPNAVKFEEFFSNLNNFESNLLNRNIIPQYTSNFTVYSEADTGAIIESIQEITWPTTDGYNIDFDTLGYSEFVNDLIQVAESNDSNRSNLMVRFLVSKSISEFDTIPDIDGTFVDTNGQKMTNALRIYGREFDELRQFAKGIAFANTVTYDKKDNTPDLVLKNLSRVMGWDLTTSISDVDLVENFLLPSDSTYDGQSVGLTTAQSEIELWRRIILNTPWIWKSKGTRKTIEFLFKFIGTPDGLVTFNEYLYVADKPLDADRITDMMEHFNDTRDISRLNIDRDGFPRTLPNNQDMYFQKAGLWYRSTGGASPDIDILYGNNPHIGPYDGGQAYIDQFTNCLVPNFVGAEGVEDINLSGDMNLFTNFGNGTFGDCCEGEILAETSTDIDFAGILSTNIDKFVDNNSVSESGCAGTTSVWSIKAYLSGELFSDEIFFSGETVPNVSDYVAGLDALSGNTELSGVTGVYTGNTYTFYEDYSDCITELKDKYIKIEVCIETNFDCIDESIAPDVEIDGDSEIICDT